MLEMHCCVFLEKLSLTTQIQLRFLVLEWETNTDVLLKLCHLINLKLTLLSIITLTLYIQIFIIIVISNKVGGQIITVFSL